MECNESMTKPGRRTRIYGLAVICLLFGAGVVYLARASFRTSAVSLRAPEPAVAHNSAMKAAPEQWKQGADERAESLLSLLRKSPDDPVLLAEIGKVYYQMRQFPTAVKYYEASIKLKPDAAILVKLGGAYHHGGDADRAIGAWNQALRLDPNNPDALFNIGFVKWHAQGDREAAIAAWEKLLKTNPNHPKRAQVEALIAQARRHPETAMTRSE